MSRLHRLVLSDRLFFVTCRLLRTRPLLTGSEFRCLANVIGSRRQEHGFLLTAWAFLPDHWHAIFFPRHPMTISRVMESIKVSSTLRINEARGEKGMLWQGRFFDRALRTVKEYHEKVEYIHRNPLTAGLVRRPEEWPWSSAREYKGNADRPAEMKSILVIDWVELPGDGRTRI